MADEDKFFEYMEASASFDVIWPPRTKVTNPRDPGNKVEIDNLGQKGEIIYIFEGKKGDKDISQLIERFSLFSWNRPELIEGGFLDPFTIIRVFHYNLERHRLVETNNKGQILTTWSYKNTKELIEILGKI